jgi:hypothetical protein
MTVFRQFQNFKKSSFFTVDLRIIVIILVTLTSFTKAAKYRSDPGKCEEFCMCKCKKESVAVRDDTEDGVACIEYGDNSTTVSTVSPTTLGTVSSTISPTNLFSVSPTTISTVNDTCCENLELSFQGQRAGNYEIQTEKFNDRSVWKLVDGQYVVWFNKDTDQWTIGSSVGSEEGFFSPSGFECPNEVDSQWTYVGGMRNARNDVSVKCLGNESLLILGSTHSFMLRI